MGFFVVLVVSFICFKERAFSVHYSCWYLIMLLASLFSYPYQMSLSYSPSYMFLTPFLASLSCPCCIQMNPTSAALSVKSPCGKSNHQLPGKFREPDPELSLRISHPFREVVIGCLEVPSPSSHKPEQFIILIQV